MSQWVAFASEFLAVAAKTRPRSLNPVLDFGRGGVVEGDRLA